MRINPFKGRAPVVSVLRLSGVISPAPQLMRGALSLAELAGPIQQAFETKGVKAVALSVNSPGGSPVQSSLIGKRIRALAREKEIPVFAFVEDVAASGGYWLACAADEIFADPTSIVGSIGVVSAGFGFPDALDKLGVERRVYTQGRNKAILDPFKPENPDDIERLKALQKDIHEAFISHVKDRRGRRLKGDDDALFNGDVWTGGQAQALGLVDGLGDLRTVMRDRFGEKVQLRVVGANKSWIRRRLGLSGLDFAGAAAGGVIHALEERALWARYGL